MASIPHIEIEGLLAGPHQAVLSVGRDRRGPVAVPMSYVYTEGQFRMITSPDSLHGRLIRQVGRATLTVHQEDYPDRAVSQWYVMAEGPVTFSEDDPVPLLRALLAKDRGETLADEWTRHMAANVSTVAVLIPELVNGYRFNDQLG